MKKQLVSILFALCMVLCLVPLAAFAEGETENVRAVTDQTGLFNAMADNTVTTVKLTADIYIGATLTVDREVKLDLNGHVLQMASSNSSPVIEVKKADNGSSIGNLTLADSDSNAVHKFTPNTDGLWVLDEENGTKTVNGGVITGGKYMGIFVNGGYYQSLPQKPDEADCVHLIMEGGNIVGCTSTTVGGGVFAGYHAYFTMTDGSSIRGCVAKGGGGVYLSTSASFAMGGSALIADCISTEGGVYGGGGIGADTGASVALSGNAVIQNCTAQRGGGVYLNGATLTMSGNASITGCTSIGGGGGVSAGGDADPQNPYIFTMTDNSSIKDCTALNGGGIFVTTPSGIVSLSGSAKIEKCRAVENDNFRDFPYVTGGGVHVSSGSFEMSGGSIESCTAVNGGDSVSVIYGGGGKFTMTGGTVDGSITMPYPVGNDTVYMDGLGTAAYPYQISNAAQLKLFHDIVNGENGRTQKLDACATLTADIVLNDGTFDEDGNYTHGPSGAATPTEWTFIGRDYEEAYSGTFDGAGHTIQGIYCNDQIKGRAGLFGYVNGATIKDIKVTGYIKTYGLAGGIAAYIRGGTSITDCVNAATVIAGDTRGYSPSAGGIVGCSERKQQNQITDCINTGTVKVIVPEGDYSSAGGILGQAISCTLISNCSNFGPISGGRLENATSKKSYVGGIVGHIVSTTVSDCYNTGTVTDTVNPEAQIGGIVGCLDSETSHLANSYNVGKVTAASAAANLGGVAGSVSDKPATITNCYYLTGTAGQACGQNKGVITNTTEKSAFDFANGDVLTLLMAKRPADAQPWDTTCKYLEFAGMTLPVLAKQNLTVHTHVWSTYTTDTAAKTHTHSCACGVAETEACTITPATCKDGSACAVCGQQYGGPDTGKHADLQHFPAVAATTDAEGNKEYWYCGGCGKYFADAAAAKEITRADTVTAKLPQPTTPPTATPTASPTAQPTTAPQAAEQPRRTAQPTVQPTAAPTVQPVSTIPATGDASSPILWAALLLCSGTGLAVTAYKKNTHRS